MSKSKVTPQTVKTPRTVALGSYVRDLALTAFVVGTVLFITGYFVSININNDAQAQVVENMTLVQTQAPVKK
jgi:hypothetical protein